GPMRSPPSGHSLRTKVMVGTLLPLLVILALASSLQYLRHRDLMVRELSRSAQSASRILVSSLRRAMMINDRQTISLMVREIAAQRGVRHLFILNKEGEIAFSAVPWHVGVKLDIEDRTCQACHQHPQASKSASLIIAEDGGRRLLRSVTSIPKGRKCQACHLRDEETYGILIADFDMTELEANLAAELRSTVLWSFGALALLAVIIGANMRRLIVRPVERLTEAVRRVGQGELSHRVGQAGDDEIGELSRTFDRMAEGLEGKAALERQVRERTEALQVERDKLAALNTIAETVSHSLLAEEVMASALEAVLKLTGLQAGWITLYDRATESFRLVLTRGLSPAFAEQEAARPPEGCISKLVRAKRACVIRDIRECQRLSPEVVAGEGLACHACIPLLARGQVLGVLNLASAQDSPEESFPPDRLQLLTAIGQQIGVAVENAGLYEELARKEALGRRLIEQLWTVQEDERRRIARELHDHTGQALTSLLVGLRMLAESSDAEEMRQRAAGLREIAAEALEAVHDLAVQLRPSVLDDMGLVAATQHITAAFAGHFGMQVHFQAVGFEGRRLPPAVETTLFRIVQEALTNVARHARAQNVDVVLECRGDTALALVEDDGRGFDVEATLGQRDAGHLGLFGMQERAALVGGQLTVESSGGGTTVLVEIPLACASDNHQGRASGVSAEAEGASHPGSYGGAADEGREPEGSDGGE
ncbi:MAG: GAF domain-containing protein, partial [Anaerolineae bacterium]|nr:GAF domain-containing protein [Anaerolineae bacterium]